MPLSSEELIAYLEPLTPDQAAVIRHVRQLIFDAPLRLEERVETGKWYTGLLVYEVGGMTVFALGPLSGGFTTLHMMPYYGSPKLQERHGAVLKPFLSGKSCVKFRHLNQVPDDALRDIFAAGPAFVEAAKIMFEARRKSKKN